MKDAKRTKRQLNDSLPAIMTHKIKPMLCRVAEKPFNGDSWLFEIKWDGYRAIAEVYHDQVHLYSRNLKSFQAQFPDIVKALQELDTDAIFDGEIVVFNENGDCDFQSLQNYQRGEEGDLRYYVFDLLYYKGRDLRQTPLIERKQLLRKLIPKDVEAIVQYSSHVIGQGIKCFALAQERKLEGIIAKKCQSDYISRRSSSWLKFKICARQEAVICGFTAPKGGRKHFGALILGLYDEGRLRHIGHVGTGFDDKSLSLIFQKLRPLIKGQCPFAMAPATNTKPTWVQPKLLCEASFTEWTKEGQMRHPVFRGLREDKAAKAVHREGPS